MIHLDTSFPHQGAGACSREDLKLREWLLADEPLEMSGIVWAEFLCGPVEPRHVDLALQIVHQLEPFGRRDAELAAGLFDQTGRRRGTLTDCMIAATAMRVGGSLATANADDFRRFVSAGLRLLTA